jgi:D-threo-aldose 1-dehydrogenase
LQIQYIETGVFDAVIHHNRYTLLNRSADPLIDAAVDRGLAVLNAAPYGSGLLVKGPDAYPRYAYQQAPAEMIDRVRRYAAISERYGVPLPAVALQFSTRDPRMTATIVGMSRPERIAETIRYLTTPIPNELWDEIAEIPFDMNDPEEYRFQRN